MILFFTNLKDILDYVAYVAKDDKGRACYVFECSNGSANNVITTIGQAFELRFKKFLNSMPNMQSSSPQITKTLTANAANASTNANLNFNQNNAVPHHLDHHQVHQYQHSQQTSSVLKAQNGNFSSASSANHFEHTGHLQNTHQPPPPPPPPHHQHHTSNHHSNTQAQIQNQNQPSHHNNNNHHHHHHNQNGVSLGGSSNKPPISNQNSSTPTTGNASRGDMQFKKPIEQPVPFTPTTNTNTKNVNNNVTNSNGKLNGSASTIGKCDEKLEKMPWFHGLMTREQAEKLLTSDGDYLVRETNKADRQYVLSGRYKGECRHIFLVDPNGVVS
jgi:hypothetical protein